MYSFLHHPNLSKTEHFVLQVILLTLLSCYKLNRCYIKLSLVNILENVFVFIEILFKMLLFKGGVLIYAEHCIYMYIYTLFYFTPNFYPIHFLDLATATKLYINYNLYMDF